MVLCTTGKKAGQLEERSKLGKLRHPMPEPRFLADPAHQKKTFRNHVCTLKNGHDPTTANLKTRTGTKKRMSLMGTPLGFTEIDMLRLSRNFACMFRQLKGIPWSKWEDAGKAVVEHHFDKHKFCGDFCMQKKEPERKVDDPLKVHRSKSEDARLHKHRNTQ